MQQARKKQKNARATNRPPCLQRQKKSKAREASRKSQRPISLTGAFQRALPALHHRASATVIGVRAGVQSAENAFAVDCCSCDAAASTTQQPHSRDSNSQYHPLCIAIEAERPVTCSSAARLQSMNLFSSAAAAFLQQQRTFEQRYSSFQHSHSLCALCAGPSSPSDGHSHRASPSLTWAESDSHLMAQVHAAPQQQAKQWGRIGRHCKAVPMLARTLLGMSRLDGCNSREGPLTFVLFSRVSHSRNGRTQQCICILLRRAAIRVSALPLLPSFLHTAACRIDSGAATDTVARPDSRVRSASQTRAHIATSIRSEHSISWGQRSSSTSCRSRLATHQQTLSQRFHSSLDSAPHFALESLCIQCCKAHFFATLCVFLAFAGALSPDFVRDLLHHLALDGWGAWEDGGSSPRSLFVLSSERRLVELSDAIWNFIDSSGSSHALLTLYELQTGDAARGCVFFGLDALLLLHAVKLLEARGKCAVIPALIVSETGVKFSG